MSGFRVRPVKPRAVRVEAPPSHWSTAVALFAAAAAGGGRVERVEWFAASLPAVLLERLGYSVERGDASARVEPASEPRDVVLNVGCSYDYAVFVGVAAGALAAPGARVVLRACQELVEADWRPLLEAVAAYGGRAWATGDPRGIIVVEAVGRGRLKAGLWRVMRSLDTSAHIASLIIAALAAPAPVYIRVLPRDPPAKTDIDAAVYAAGVLGGVEYGANYARFRIEPGAEGGRLEARPDVPLTLHLAGFSAMGARVELAAWRAGDTPYEPLSVARRLAEQMGYVVEDRGFTLVFTGFEAARAHRLFFYDEPDYAAPAATLAAAAEEEVELHEVPRGYRSDLDDVIGVLASLGYSVETGEEYYRVAPPRLAEGGVAAEVVPVVTCTTPHVPPAAIVAAARRGSEVIVERWECMRGVWPGFYRLVEELGLAARGAHEA